CRRAWLTAGLTGLDGKTVWLWVASAKGARAQMKSMSQTELRRRPALLQRAQGRIIGIGRIDEGAVLDAYRRWAPIYDYTFGMVAREGRRHAVELINEGTGRVLEVGVGTGLSLPDYDKHLEIVGI